MRIMTRPHMILLGTVAAGMAIALVALLGLCAAPADSSGKASAVVARGRHTDPLATAEEALQPASAPADGAVETLTRAPARKDDDNANAGGSPVGSDRGILSLQRTLEHLFTPQGRATYVSRTNLDEIVKDKSYNPHDVQLDADARRALETLVDNLDHDITEARIHHAVVTWTALIKAVEQKRFLAIPNEAESAGKAVDEATKHYAGAETDRNYAVVAGADLTHQRLVRLYRDTDGDWFASRDKVSELQDGKVRAIRAFFGSLQKGR